MTTQALTVAVTGGGTGGHAIPAMNIIDELRRQSPETGVIYIGAANSIEQRLCEGRSLAFNAVRTVQLLRPVYQPRNLLMPFILVNGILQARKILRREQVGLVIGTGGFSSFPALTAARMMGLPYVINEQNAQPGIVNRLLGGGAKRLYLGYQEAAQHFWVPSEVVRYTGNPVSFPNLGENGEDALNKLGLEAGRKTLFITGGSGGSRKINRAASEIVEGLLQDDWNVIWQVGRLEAAFEGSVEVDSIWRGRMIRDRFFSQEFMATAMTAADLAVARCGAMTLGELALAGLPAVLVPYPYAAEGHQEVNARAVEAAGGGVVILDRELDGMTLRKKIDELDGIEMLPRMRDAMSSLAHPGAVREIVKDLLTALK